MPGLLIGYMKQDEANAMPGSYGANNAAVTTSARSAIAISDWVPSSRLRNCTVFLIQLITAKNNRQLDISTGGFFQLFTNRSRSWKINIYDQHHAMFQPAERRQYQPLHQLTKPPLSALSILSVFTAASMARRSTPAAQPTPATAGPPSISDRPS